MKPILLVGCGGHARSLIDLIESTSEWSVGGLVGLPDEVGRRVLGYPVIATDHDLPELRSDYELALLALGQLPDPSCRMRLASELASHRYQSPTIISPHAVVSKRAQLGLGTVVGHGAIINTGSIIGRHSIINSACLIEHDSEVGDFCHISTGALVNGGVCIGSGSFIGSGAVLRECLRLPPSTVVSAGKRVMGWPLSER